MFPIFPLVNVGGAELPVLVRLIDAREESLSLLFERQMQKYLDDLRAVAMEMFLQIAMDSYLCSQMSFSSRNSSGKSLAAQKLRMHSNDQHFFVIRAIEYPDSAALGKAARGAP